MLMLALLLTAALSAQAIDAFAVSAAPATVIAWLAANRNTLVQVGGARAIERRGNVLHVRQDGIDVWLTESADVHTDWATYKVRMLAANRKLKSWDTFVSLQPAGSGTWISMNISASVYGFGQGQVDQEVREAMARVKRYLLGVFR